MLSGELPDLREIHTYQGLVVTGSHYSTRDDHAHPWIGALKRFIVETVVHGGARCTARASDAKSSPRRWGERWSPTRAACLSC